ncbi:hypothetical protein [Neptunomonas japonica]|uniref:Uncharacterized protein n=1 Tax=Neptunomonas japonica JAMM 1380 TaxID=1441457 RepID=A0A7R6PK22_9GAMM|nr:hypothetical protein [Neptunomonas japonica]BBB30561.1 conserved hypothetical protein [Neptunomonas japonica JAMM 1380]
MSSTGTAIIIVIVIGVLIGVTIIIQSIENQRQQKRTRMQAIRNNIRNVEQLYDTLPSGLVSEQLNHLVSQHINFQWKNLLLLDNTSASQKAAQESLQRLSGFSPDNTYPAGSLTLLNDKNEAQKATLAARELSQWLQTLKKNSTAAHTINDLLTHLQYCHAQANIDCMIFDAIECEQMKGRKVSIHQYKNCLNSLNNMHHFQKHDRQVFELSSHIEALSNQADEADQEAASKDAKETSH